MGPRVDPFAAKPSLGSPTAQGVPTVPRVTVFGYAMTFVAEIGAMMSTCWPAAARSPAFRWPNADRKRVGIFFNYLIRPHSCTVLCWYCYRSRGYADEFCVFSFRWSCRLPTRCSTGCSFLHERSAGVQWSQRSVRLKIMTQDSCSSTLHRLT